MIGARLERQLVSKSNPSYKSLFVLLFGFVFLTLMLFKIKAVYCIVIVFKALSKSNFRIKYTSINAYIFCAISKGTYHHLSFSFVFSLHQRNVGWPTAKCVKPLHFVRSVTMAISKTPGSVTVCNTWSVYTSSCTSSPLNKMAATSQTIFSEAFSRMKSFVVWLKFHWSLSPRAHSTITQHWFR